jgi:Putative zinc-finger
MTHLELENLASDYLEGQLEQARRREVEAHLTECAPCLELVADLRHALELCRSAEEVEPAPWLVPKILLATIGERKPTLRERLDAFFQPVLRPRVAYSVAMAVFSLSIIVNAAGLNLRDLTLADLNPRNWAYQANRTGHLLYARAEKFYYDLRVVYEIESRLRQIRQDSGSSGSSPEKGTPKSEPAPGSTTDGKPPMNPQMAEARSPFKFGPGVADFGGEDVTPASLAGTRRSPLQ